MNAKMMTVACALLAGSLGAADALKMADWREVRLAGAVGEAADRCIAERTGSDWARGDMYEECVNAFRTHWDDLGVKGKGGAWGGWQNEYWGKTMLCFAGAVAYGKDEGLRTWVLDKAHAFIDEFQKPNGYLSTYFYEDWLTSGQEFPKGNRRGGTGFNIWGRKYTMWALIDLYRATGDKACLAAAEKMADHLIAQLKRLNMRLTNCGNWYGVSAMSIMKPMLVLHEITGKKEYLDLAADCIATMRDPANRTGALLYDAKRKEPIMEWHEEEPTYWAKAYEILSCLEGVVEYYRVTGDRQALDEAIAYHGHLEREEINPMRSAGYFDHFLHAKMRVNGMTELCDVTHWIRLNKALLAVTGEAKYADLAEEAFYNAFLAGVTRDGRWGAHIVKSHGARHLWAPPQTGMFEHQCCPDNMMRTYFDVAMMSAAAAQDDATAVLFYSDAELKLPGATVKVSGGYPWSENAVSVTVDREKAGKVRFRIPRWTRDAFRLNGRELSAADGWCTVDAPAGRSAWNLRFDMKPRIDYREGVRAERILPSPVWKTKDATELDYYTVQRFDWMCPEIQGLCRSEPAAQVLRGPLVLAKGRFAGTSREETLFATSIREHMNEQKSWQASLERLQPSAANAGVGAAWNLTLRCGREKRTVVVSDFASVSNVDDPSNWFSVWF